MANFPAAPANTSLLAAPLPGRGTIGRRRNHPPRLKGRVLTASPASSIRFTGNGSPRSQPPGASVGQIQVRRQSTIGLDWFDHVHVLPRTVMDFGNVVTTSTKFYELFNAYDRAIIMNAFVNGVGGGITTPSLPSVPFTVDAFNSILNPTSIRGALLRLAVQADVNGSPNFDGTLDFYFSPGLVQHLHVVGQRVVLLPYVTDGEVRETLEFLTKILPTVAGAEQRISLRLNPRQRFEVRYVLEGLDRRRMQTLLFGWQARNFALPLWQEQLIITAPASSGSAFVTVASTADTDLRVGGLAAVIKDSSTVDVLEIQSITSTQVNFTSNLLNTYAAGALLCPARVCRLLPPPTSSRPPVVVEAFDLLLSCVENDTGAPTPSTALYSSLLGHPIVDTNLLYGKAERSDSFDQRLYVVDNESGLVTTTSEWTRHKHGFEIGFSPKTRAALYALRLFLLAMRGRQVSFWAPTFIADLVPTASLTSATNLMKVENVGYGHYVQNRHPKATFKITFTDGSSLFRTIIASTELSAAEEQLTLDTTWPSTKTAAEVSRIEFYELCRFDSDDLTLRHSSIGRATLTAPARVVFDTP